MKIQLETEKDNHEPLLCGIVLTSENKEDEELLKRLWLSQGRPVSFENAGSSISLTFAPTERTM